MGDNVDKMEINENISVILKITQQNKIRRRIMVVLNVLDNNAFVYIIFSTSFLPSPPRLKM